MIEANFGQLDSQVLGLLEAFNALPRNIAKKHLGAAMKRTLKPAVPALKKNTPKARTQIRIRRDGAVFRIPGGALRRAAAVKSKYVSKSGYGTAYGVLGFKNVSFNVPGYGATVSQSRKAIWLHYGTNRGVSPRAFMEQTIAQVGGPAASQLASELKKALEKATNELSRPK